MLKYAITIKSIVVKHMKKESKELCFVQIVEKYWKTELILYGDKEMDVEASIVGD